MNLLNCKLASIFNPGEYMILSLDENHSKEVKHLEDILTNEIKCNDMKECSYQIHPRMNVAVKVSNLDENFKRGIVKNSIEEDLYEIFLLDYGKDVILNKSDIVLYSNNIFNNVEPLSFTLSLYGLLPTYMCSVNGVKKLRISNEWMKESFYFIKSLFHTAEEIKFQTILIYNKKISGDLFLKLENKFISLRKLLIESKYCVLSENYFLTNVCEMDNKFLCENRLQQKTKFYETETDKKFDGSSTFKENKCNILLIYKKLEKQKAVLKIKEIKNFEKYSNISKEKDSSFNNDEGKPLKCNFYKESSNLGNFSLKTDDSTETIQKNNNLKELIPNIVECKFKKFGNEIELDKIFSVNNPLLEFQANNIHSNLINESFKMESFSEEKGRKVEMPKLVQYSEPFILFKNCDPVKPINKFEDLNIKADIIENFKKYGNFKNPSTLQRWAIPAIQKGENVVMIGSAQTGKTVSYIIPVTDFVVKNIEKLSEGNGPMVVIICSSSSIGEVIYTFFQCLLDNISKVQNFKSKIEVVLAHGGKWEDKNWINLTNGCHILISTPFCLKRLLEMPILTNFERLSYMVLDEVDLISEKPFKENLHLILEKSQIGSNNQKFQTIFCGERWTSGVESLTKIYLKSTYALIIGSYSEAAVYSKLKPTIYLTDQNYKKELLLEKIKDDIGKCKILVACENVNEAIPLNNYLIKNKIDTIVAHENIISQELKGIIKKWNCYPFPVVIVTDYILDELKLQNIDVLVHYCLTEKSKSNFFFRYATFLSSEKPQKKDVILMDNNNYIQLPHIIDFVVRLGGKVPSLLLEKCNEIQRQIEISKKKSICKILLTTGFCRKSKECSYRHAFNLKLDSPQNHPSSGWIIFTPVKIINASSFFVKIIEYTDFNGKKSKINYNFKVFQDLNEWFNIKKNRVPHGFPNLGDICAIKSCCSNQEVFHRVRIVEYCELDKYNQPNTVRVSLIDEGGFKELKNIELYELPKKFANILPLTVEVKLAGIQPVDFDIYWNRSANKFSEMLMLQKIDKNQYWKGKIVLALKNILFLEPILLKRFLPNLNVHVTDFVLEEKFIENKIAIKNHSYLPNLIKLCTEAGIEILTNASKNKIQTTKPDWAFFDKDLVEVKFLAAENTSTIFFTIAKFLDLLKDLKNACQLEGERKRSKIVESNEKHFLKLSTGMICLAFCDKRWSRGKIESENKTYFYIFFVDNGNYQFVNKTNCVPISESLLLRLPFQAIECSLIGIESKLSSTEVVKEILNFTNNEQIKLHAQIVRKELKTNLTSCYKYSINLLNSNGKSFNKYLVESELANLIGSEKKYLTNADLMKSMQKIDSNLQDDFKEKNVFFRSDTRKDLTDSLLSDHLFESKSDKNFLQEFANKIIDIKSVNCDASKALCEKSLKNSVFVPPTQGEKSNDLNQGKKLLEKFRKRRNEKQKESKEELNIKIRENILTPKVFWSQNHSKIQLKICLNSIEKYFCEMNDTNLLFRCYVDDNIYAVDLKFYGTIIPKYTSVSVQTFHTIINLKKKCFLNWPRILKDDEKYQWISADSESPLSDSKIDDSYSDEIQKVKRNIDAGILKDSIRMDKIYDCSDSESMDWNKDYDSLEEEEY